MPYQNPESTILAARHLVESDRRSEIRLKANGGNSILIVCPPREEPDFIKAIEAHLPAESFSVLDMNYMLIRFVELNKDTLEESFELRQSSVHQIFKTPDAEEDNDLYSLIIDGIRESYQSGKVPVLINTGALYGSGLDNIHIMEHKVVMNGPMPLIILYPATKEGDKLMFLSKRPASKYRCMIID